MKKLFTFAIIVMAAMAILFAMDSCKKDAQNAPSNIPPQSAQAFDPTLIEDMNAYLSDFKKKMQESKDGETLSLEEAAWHLSSIANYDFANANVECNDIRFDTLYSTITITNGTVLLSDLAVAYERISTDIEKFYNSLMLENKHFRFIKASISENGMVSVMLMTTYIHASKYLGDTLWAYPNMWDLAVDCYEFFNEYPVCPAETQGQAVLEHALNLIESHPQISYGIIYYTPTLDTTFKYRNEIDPFGSPFYLNSRLFANNTYFNADIIPAACYLLDSSVGLGNANRPSGQYIICWHVIYGTEPPHPEDSEPKWIEFYDLEVIYGTRHVLDPGSGGGNQ